MLRPILGVTLPNLPITVVRRSDSKRDDLRIHQASVGDQPNLPGEGGLLAPRCLGRKATSLSLRRKTTASPPPSSRRPGAIGYIEYGYAKLTKAATALLENKAGNLWRPATPPARPPLRAQNFRRISSPGSTIPNRQSPIRS